MTTPKNRVTDPAGDRLELIAATSAAIGMFVAELDRPWIETPFLLQGFLIEDDVTLSQLRELCRFIYIDRTRSLGAHFRAPAGSGEHSAQRRIVRPRAAVSDAEPDGAGAGPEFLEVLALVRKGGLDMERARRLAGPSIAERPETCSVERELLRATPSYIRAEEIFDQVVTDVRENRRPDMDQMLVCVDDMIASVKRNPDALLWLIRLKHHDRFSYQHSLDVTVHLTVFAHSMGFAEEGIRMLGMVGMMQDLGKLRLPDRVLKKAGRLTRLEMEIAKTHVDFSTQIVRESGSKLPGLLETIARHHERYDGSGYPAGLRGAAVGLHAEMAGVVDSFCAMTGHRAYEEPLSTQRALENLVRLRDEKFSAAVIDAFVQCIGLYPAGTLVELNSGEVGVVIAQNRVRRLQPRVLVLLDPDRTPNRHPPTLDLLLGPTTPAGETYRILRALPAGTYGIDPTEFYLA